MCLGSPLIPLRRCLPATHRPSRSKARWLDPITLYHNGSPPAQLLQAIIVYAVVVGELMDHRSPHLLRKGGGVPSRPVLKRSPEQCSPGSSNPLPGNLSPPSPSAYSAQPQPAPSVFRIPAQPRSQ